MRTHLLLLCVSTACLADPVLKNAGVRLGSVTTLDCGADAGISCTRASGTATGRLACSSASGTELGCVTPDAQTLGGVKTFAGVAVHMKGTLNVDGGVYTPGRVEADGGFRAYSAYSYFPTCDADHEGLLLFDATNLAWTTCVFGAWVGQPIYASAYVSGYFPGAPATTNIATVRWKTSTGAAGNQYQVRNGYFVPLVVGVGAGNAVWTLYNASDAGTPGVTCTVPCTSAVGTPVACSGNASVAQDVLLELRLTTNGCGTLPSGNLVLEQRAVMAH